MNSVAMGISLLSSSSSVFRIPFPTVRITTKQQVRTARWDSSRLGKLRKSSDSPP